MVDPQGGPISTEQFMATVHDNLVNGTKPETDIAQFNALVMYYLTYASFPEKLDEICAKYPLEAFNTMINNVKDGEIIDGLPLKLFMKLHALPFDKIVIPDTTPTPILLSVLKKIAFRSGMMVHIILRILFVLNRQCQRDGAAFYRAVTEDDVLQQLCYTCIVMSLPSFHPKDFVSYTQLLYYWILDAEGPNMQWLSQKNDSPWPTGAVLSLVDEDYVYRAFKVRVRCPNSTYSELLEMMDPRSAPMGPAASFMIFWLLVTPDCEWKNWHTEVVPEHFYDFTKFVITHCHERLLCEPGSPQTYTTLGRAKLLLLHHIRARDRRMKLLPSSLWLKGAIGSSDGHFTAFALAASRKCDDHLLTTNIDAAVHKLSTIYECAPFCITPVIRMTVLLQYLRSDIHTYGTCKNTPHQRIGTLDARRDIQRVYAGIPRTMQSTIQNQRSQTSIETEIAHCLFSGHINDVPLFVKDEQNKVLPNPVFGQFPQLLDRNVEEIYRSIGRLLARFFIKGYPITTEISHFFLQYLMGHVDSSHDINNLQTVGKSTFQDLIALREGRNAVESSPRYFNITKCDGTTLVELIRLGNQKLVTEGNLLAYIERIVHYKLHVSYSKQFDLIISGIRERMCPRLFSFFSPFEISCLLRQKPDEINGELTETTMLCDTRLRRQIWTR